MKPLNFRNYNDIVELELCKNGMFLQFQIYNSLFYKPLREKIINEISSIQCIIWDLIKDETSKLL